MQQARTEYTLIQALFIELCQIPVIIRKKVTATSSQLHTLVIGF